MDNDPYSVSLKGSFLVGGLCNYALMGALGVQAYIYYITFTKDKLTLKALVFFVLCIDTAQTIVCTHSIWSILVSGGRVYHIQSLGALGALTGLVILIVQCFFAWRIWVLGGPCAVLIPIISVITITAVGSCVLGTIFGVTLSSASLGPFTMFGSFGGWALCNLISNIFVTVTLIMQLRSKINQDFRYTGHVLHRAIRFALETGVLTCILAITELALFFDWTTSYESSSLVVISGKVYSNALLASLNSRAPVFRRGDPGEEEAWRSDHSSGTTGPNNVILVNQANMRFEPQPPSQSINSERSTVPRSEREAS